MTRGGRSAAGERGAVIPVVALSLVFLMAGTALSVDVGRLAARTRDLQSVADLAALDGARLLDGRSESQLYPSVEAAVVDSARRNGFLTGPPEAVVADLGCFDRATSTWDTACARPDAVRVTASDEVPFYFQAGSRTTSRTGTARRDPVVDMSLGSLEAGFHPQIPTTVSADAKARVLNATVDAFFEVGLPDVVDVHIDAIGYQGLAAASMTLGDLAAQLGFASPEQLLTSEVGAEDFVVAMADLLDGQGKVAEADVLQSFATGIDNTLDLRLGRYVQLDSGTGSAATADINALDLLVGGAQVVNGTNFADTAFAGAIGPVQVSDLRLVVVENKVRRPRARLGDSARTAQMRASVMLEVPVALDLESSVTEPLDPLLPPSEEPTPEEPTIVMVRLPIVAEMAGARAEVRGIACREPVDDSETAMRVFTDAFRIHVGQTADLETDDLVVTDVPIIDAVASLPLLSGGATGSSTFSLADHQVDVDPPFIGPYGDHNTRRVYGHGGPSATTGLVANLTTSLGSTFTSQLQQALTATLPNLDDELFGPLFEVGGVGLGGADVTAHGLDCTTPMLVD